MRLLVLILASALFGVVVCTATFLVYVYGGHFTGGFSTDPADWSAFGSYFGGVVGPLFALGTVVLLIVTIMQQEHGSKRIHREQLKQDHLRYFATIHEDILYLMRRPLHDRGGRRFEFGDVFLGIESPPDHDPSDFKTLLSRLLEHVASYAEAISFYRINVNTYFEYKAHYARVNHLVTFLGKHITHLENTQPVTLALARHNLEQTGLGSDVLRHDHGKSPGRPR